MNTFYKAFTNNELMKYVLAFLLMSVVTGLVAQELDVEEVTIVGEYIPDEKLETSEVSDILDAEDISIAGDSNIGEALKRLPGVSLVGGKFVYVRGLGERYSSTYFNGTPLPGVQPLKRAVPLDLFDPSVTSSVLVQKTYSVNYGAAFSGGVVDIRSAAIPDNDFFKFKLKTGYETESTGETGLDYKGGDDDKWGFDDGTRDLPAVIQANRNVAPNIFSSLPQTEEFEAKYSFDNSIWTPTAESNDPDFGLSMALGRYFDASQTITVGGIFTLSYDKKTRTKLLEDTRWSDNQAQAAVPTFNAPLSAGQIRDQLIASTDDDDTPLDDAGITELSNEYRTSHGVDLSGLLSFGVQITDLHTIKLTQMLLRKSNRQASLERIKQPSISGLVGEDLFLHRLDWVENEIDFKQISGEHFFGENTLKWRYSKVDGERLSPDSRVYSTSGSTRSLDLVDSGEQPSIAKFDFDTNPFRTWTELFDESEDIGFDLEFPFYIEEPYLQSITIKTGYSSFEKEREYNGLRFEYGLSSASQISPTDQLLPIEQLLDTSTCFADLSANPGTTNEPGDSCYVEEPPASIFAGNNGAIEVDEGFGQDADTYTGEIELEAIYLALDMQLTDFWRLSLGVRDESYDVGVISRRPPPSVGAIVPDPLVASQSSDQLYPAASLTWNFTDNMQMRVAYSQSENRPIMRELSTVRLFNAEDGRLYRGNNNLFISEIESYDLRYEWYFGDADYLSISLFKKRIDKPVELFEDTGTSGATVFSWLNRRDANTEGFELELRKYFGDYWFMTFNTTNIYDAEVTGLLQESLNTDEDIGNDVAGKESISDNEDPNRPLQGLSDELYNFQIVYENEKNTAALSWNTFSKRVYFVDEGAGEIYEQPFSSLNFNYKLKFEREEDEFTVGLKATNLLGDNLERTYKNGLPYESYDIGQSFSVSVQWKHESW